MKSSAALASLWAVLLISGCARDPEVPAAAPSVAQPAEDTSVADAPATPCEDATDQSSMTACWSQASRTEQERVDAAQKKLDELFASKASAAAQEQLRDDQRRWREFVEGHCSLYAKLYEGGSAAPMTAAVCRWQLAQSRAEQLDRLIQDLDR